MNKLFLIFIISFLISGPGLHSQHLQFSQYNFILQKVNPSVIGQNNMAMISALHRNQNTGADFNLITSGLSAEYPLYYQGNNRNFGGLGIMLLDDRSGTTRLFNRQEIALSFAVRTNLSKYQSLSVGMSASYHTFRINTEGLSTGMQFIPGRGFDYTVFNGENFGREIIRYMSLGAGLHWQKSDRYGNTKVYGGLSIFDVNRPDVDVTTSKTRLHPTMIFSSGLVIFQNDVWRVMPEILYSGDVLNSTILSGFTSSYILDARKPKTKERLDFITKYSSSGSIVTGVQLHKMEFSVGFSYDFPIIKKNPANHGSFEFGFQLKNQVNPFKVKQRNFARNKRTTQKRKYVALSKANARNANWVDSTRQKYERPSFQTRTEKLLYKQDSVINLIQQNALTDSLFVLENLTLDYQFKYNSAVLEERFMPDIEELAEVLKSQKNFHLKIIGYTDNVGSSRFNDLLSLRRAEAMKDELVSRGVSPDRIQTDGRGMREPIASNETEEGRAKNRRIEIIIFYKRNE